MIDCDWDVVAVLVACPFGVSYLTVLVLLEAVAHRNRLDRSPKMSLETGLRERRRKETIKACQKL